MGRRHARAGSWICADVLSAWIVVLFICPESVCGGLLGRSEGSAPRSEDIKTISTNTKATSDVSIHLDAWSPPPDWRLFLVLPRRYRRYHKPREKSPLLYRSSSTFSRINPEGPPCAKTTPNEEIKTRLRSNRKNW